MTTDGDLEDKPGGNGPEEQTDVPPPPVFMRDEPPSKGKMNMIKWALMHGFSEEDVVNQGYNAKTVGMAAFYLEQDGYRKRPSKAAKREADQGAGASKAVAKTSGKSYVTPQKSLPPEFLIDQIVLPIDGNSAKVFEQGIKFGASILVLGVRVAQELSNMGMQQARPIMDMANAMRAGEAEAAKGAAAEAAYTAAELVKAEMMPTLAGMNKPAPSADPMKDMMARLFEPMLSRMMNTVMPGAGGQQGALPAGWTRSTKEE